MIFLRAYGLKFLPDAFNLVSQSLNIISRFEVDIRSIGIEIPAGIAEHTDLYQ